MDPNATLAAFIAAIGEGDILGAQEAADNLATWLGRGGFEPNWIDAEKQAFLMFITLEPVYAN